MSVKWKEKVCGKRRGTIQQELEKLLALWLKFPDNQKPERRGFVCSLVDPDRRELLMPTFYVGDVDRKTAFECGFIHFEKGARMLDHPDDRTSAKSADPDAKSKPFHQRRYAGAVRCDKVPLLILISALPWEGDQSIGTALGNWLGGFSTNAFNSIGEESGDSTYLEFIEYCEAQDYAAAI